MTSPQLANAMTLYARRHGYSMWTVRDTPALLDAAKAEWAGDHSEIDRLTERLGETANWGEGIEERARLEDRIAELDLELHQAAPLADPLEHVVTTLRSIATEQDLLDAEIAALEQEQASAAARLDILRARVAEIGGAL